MNTSAYNFPGSLWSSVTGCSSGLGLNLTQAVLAKGERVIATLRKPEAIAHLAEKYSKEQLLILSLDVRFPDQIDSAFDATRDKFGRLGVVVNNAGYGLLGEVEGTDDATARNLFDVIFWGAVTISRKVDAYLGSILYHHLTLITSQ